MQIDIVGHPSGDWKALYINGKLMNEEHTITADDIVEALKSHLELDTSAPIFSIKYNTRDLCNEDGFDKDYQFPIKYEDITI